MAKKEYVLSDKEETTVVLGDGYVVTQAEIEWAKEEIANSPKGKYLSIADAIAIKRGIEQFERGEYEVWWQKK